MSEPASRQVLTFRLAGEEYGLGILKVQEIRGWSPVTPIPRAPLWVLGVIDLRGAIVPVVDLRRRFELPPAEFGPATVIIVLRVASGSGERTIGLVVDEVSEVYDIDPSCLRAVPDIGGGAAQELVAGLARTNDRTILLLDAERLAVGSVHSRASPCMPC